MLRLSATVIAIVLLVLPAFALAKPKVAIAPIDNDSGEVQDAVVDALDGSDLILLSPKQVARAVDKLGLDSEMSEKDLKKLAKELEADAVVQGSLTSKGGNKVLHFKLFVKGKKQKGFKIEFGSAKSAKFKRALRDKMIEKLGDLGGKGGDDDEAKPPKKKHGGDDDDATPPKKKHGGDDDDATPPKKKHGGDDDDSGKSGGGDDDDTPHHKKHHGDDDDGDDTSVHGGADVDAVASHSANRFGIRLDAGISVTGRSLAFNSRNFTGTGLGPPKPYTNSPVPGARIAGEVYPLVLAGNNSPASGLGLGGMYDKTLSLTLHNQLQPNVPFPANQMRWQIGARYRFVFGSRATSPSLTIALDYGHQQFKVDRGNQMNGLVIDLPDVEYVGIIPDVSLRVPLAPSVAILVGGGSLLALKAGSIEAPEEYGQAKITSVRANAGLDIVFAKKFAVRFEGEFGQFGYVFAGNGAMANARDGDPSTIDVGGASDRYIGGAATFAVMY